MMRSFSSRAIQESLSLRPASWLVSALRFFCGGAPLRTKVRSLLRVCLASETGRAAVELVHEAGRSVRPAVIWIIAAGLLALVLVLCWPSGTMASRDIGCAMAAPGRGPDICRAPSASMEWTWMGHAIISPGWRPTWRGLAHVWCALQISDADLPALQALRYASSDWRMESGADDLIRIAKNRDGKGDEPENSIFNPKNPAYILKDGCAGK